MDKEKIFEFIYLMAFRDATMRKAFPKRNDESEEKFMSRKEKAFSEAKEIARDYIDRLMAGIEIKPETYMLEMCHHVKQHGFTFGNSQKLINMLAKYMYVICYEDDAKRKLFKNCDCPMDGAMISVLKIYGSFDVPQDFSWSRMNTDDDTVPEKYKEFQEIVREKCSDDMYAIEYDYENWFSG